jgi:RimJ/RimL family protein N-acetyltransferase
VIETPRLILRDYHEDDREAFFALNGDPRVGEWLAGTPDRAGSDAMMDRIRAHIAEHGFGFWAAERRVDGRLVGLTGLKVITPDLPNACGVEIGWRMLPEVWGQGLASEGAAAALAWAFANLEHDCVTAFTAATNLRSQAVMRKIGMTPVPALDFDHPALAADHPLRRHVVYTARRAEAVS